MGLFYGAARLIFSIPRFAAIREHIYGLERARREGPFILAVSHLSHLEPIFVGSIVPRHIRWMARIEHYRHPLSAAFLNGCRAFSVDRFGNSRPAVRRAIRLLRQGEIIGIFPEGGQATSQASALRGGPIKGGVCTMSIATRAPVIPVAVLGTDKLNAARPWLPTKSSHIWIAFGEAIHPPPRQAQSRRTLRLQMAEQIRHGLSVTYQQLLTTATLADSQFP